MTNRDVVMKSATKSLASNIGNDMKRITKEDLQMNEKTYQVRVDENNVWRTSTYRQVTEEELDKIIELYGQKVMSICSRGQNGAMAMLAFFKSAVSGGCYQEMANTYELLSGDNKSLVDREHELRCAWEHYQELCNIRWFGTMENYYLEQAKEAKAHMTMYGNE